MKILPLILIALAINAPILTAQFDTIAGPFDSANAIVASGETIYAAVATPGGIMRVRAYDINALNSPGRVLFTNPAGTPTMDMFVMGKDLYVTSSAPTIADGKIHRISAITSAQPSVELYLSLTHPPNALVIKDSIMYISQFLFGTGKILSYDMRDPEAEPVDFITTGIERPISLALDGDYLLISNAGSGIISRVNLNAPRPALTSYIRGLDLPNGMVIDGDLLYIAVGNPRINRLSGINVYELDAPRLTLDILAEGTTRAITDVERINGQTYLLEYPSDIGETGYLLRVAAPVSTQRVYPEENISVFPNPTSGKITFGIKHPERIEVIGTTGQRLLSFNAGENSYDLSELPAGIYTVLIQMPDGTTGRSRVVIK